MGLAPEGYQLIDSDLSTEVIDAILNARAPSTRKLYALKWCLFALWCEQHHLNPVDCPLGQSSFQGSHICNASGQLFLARKTNSYLNGYNVKSLNLNSSIQSNKNPLNGVSYAQRDGLFVTLLSGD